MTTLQYVRGIPWAAGLAVSCVAGTPLDSSAARLTLSAPLDYQVVQRSTRSEGTVAIRGALEDLDPARATWEVRFGAGAGTRGWQPLAMRTSAQGVSSSVVVPAGGWWRLEVRALTDGFVAAQAEVEHVGVGEVFVVAGQSNSANHGEERQRTQTRRAATFDGDRWQLADDPQPGASGQGGSFLPPLGDELAQRLDVPIGFLACGIGATSVREWLPKGAVFPNPPTIESRVERLPSGAWASKGEAYDNLIARMKSLGPRGFRAVLWHQGESDANQRDPSRTLPGSLYREYLGALIRDSRRELGWEVPWFVAQVSYHVPGDEASPEIREAQASLWREGLALEGPDSDALKGALRQDQGRGVHFSGPGLRAHGKAWAERVGAWLETQRLVTCLPLPNPLRLSDGTEVASAADWRQKRRPEPLRLFAEHVYGRTPVDALPRQRFVVREEKPNARGGRATRLRVGVLFEGTEDGRQMEQ